MHEHELREIALKYAVKSIDSNNRYAHRDTITVAEEFYKFLTGRTAAPEIKITGMVSSGN